jgi:hypothetical protein
VERRRRHRRAPGAIPPARRVVRTAHRTHSASLSHDNATRNALAIASGARGCAGTCPTRAGHVPAPTDSLAVVV